MVQFEEKSRTPYSSRPTTPSHPRSVMEIELPPVFEYRKPVASRTPSRANITRDEHINILAQPHIRPRLSDVYIIHHTEVVPITPRIEELARPNLRYVRALLYEMEEILSPDIVERLKRLLNEDFTSIYREASEYSRKPPRTPSSQRRRPPGTSRSDDPRFQRPSSAGRSDSNSRPDSRGKPPSGKRPASAGGRPGTPGGRPGTRGERPGTPGERPGTPGGRPGSRGKGLGPSGWSEGQFKDKKEEWTHTMALKLAEKLSTYVDTVDGELSPTFRREALEECLKKRLQKMFMDSSEIPSEDTEKLVDILAKQLAVWMEKFMQDLENGGDGDISLTDIPTLGLFGDAVKGKLGTVPEGGQEEGAMPGEGETPAGEGGPSDAEAKAGEGSAEGEGQDLVVDEGDAAPGEGSDGQEGGPAEGEEAGEAGEGGEAGEAGEVGEGGEGGEGGEAGEGEEAGEGGETPGEDGGPPEDKPPSDGDEAGEDADKTGEEGEEGTGAESGEEGEGASDEAATDQGTVAITRIPTTKLTADMTPAAVVAVMIRDLANMLEERYGVEVGSESEESARIVSLRQQEIKAFLMENCRNYITSLSVDGSPEWVMRAIEAAMDHLAEWMESVVKVAEKRAEERAENEPPAERPLTAEETGQWVGRLEDGVNKALCWVNWLKDAVDAAELRGMQCMRRKIPFSQHVPKDMTWRCCRETVNPRFGKGSWRREVTNRGMQFIEMKKSFTDATEKWKIQIASATVIGDKRQSITSNQG